MEDEVPKRRFYLVSHENDISDSEPGSFIPYRKKTKKNFAVPHSLRVMALPLVALSLVVALGSFWGQGFNGAQQANISQVLVETPQFPLVLGVNDTLALKEEVDKLRSQLIIDGRDFLELDLELSQLRYFKAGVLSFSREIKSKPDESSAFITAPGLYQVTKMTPSFYSSLQQVYLPWTIVFANNFYLHATPQLVPGEVNDTVSDLGGVTLADQDAKEIYELMAVGDYVLVHERTKVVDDFVYEPKVSGVTAPNYLIADLDNDSILASSDMEKAVPIASLTKLMTALIVAENISLETAVGANEKNFVTSLIPRLQSRKEVGVYSLLQLLLVESSNEAAEVLAGVLGREEFITLMNKKAEELQMLETKFADPSGLSALNISSPRDLLILTKYIKRHRNFIFEITAERDKTTTYTSGEFGNLVNFNEVRNLENFIGGKVGETIAAGQTSVSLHHLDIKNRKRTIAVVVLGSNSRDADVLTLLNYAKEQFGR